MTCSDSDLIARLLAATKTLNNRTLASRWGVSESYVSRLRSGASKPATMAGLQRAAAERLLAELEGTPAPEQWGRPSPDASFAAGVLWAIAQQAHHIKQMAVDAHQRIIGPTPSSAVFGGALGPADFGSAAELLAAYQPKRKRRAKR